MARSSLEGGGEHLELAITAMMTHKGRRRLLQGIQGLDSSSQPNKCLLQPPNNVERDHHTDMGHYSRTINGPETVRGTSQAFTY